MRLIGIPRDQLDGVAERLTPFLGEFLEGGRYTIDDRLEDIRRGDRQCWMILDKGQIRAVALTQISAERFKTCWITHLTGEGLREWATAFNEIEAWARHMGCTRIEAVARPGYERFGERFGLRKTHVVLTKEL